MNKTYTTNYRTMPTTDITGRVKSITGLSTADCTTLQGDGIATQEDLSFVRFEDLDNGISIVKRRKLELVGRYLAIDGNTLTATSTIDDIRNYLHNQTRGTTGGTSGRNSVDAGAPKVYTDPLNEFSGDPIDYEEWEGKSAATLRQTVYKTYLDRNADPTKPYEVARNAELYNMILSAVRTGHAHSRVESLKDDPTVGESGFHAWKALAQWYLDPSQKSLMLEHYSTKLDSLLLDDDGSATEFINNFDLFVRKIEKFDGAWTEAKKIREFKKRVVGKDYDVEKRTHKSTYKDLVQSFRDREQALDTEAITEKVQRRFKRTDGSDDGRDSRSSDGNSKDSGDGTKSCKKESHIPFIPGFLFKTFDSKTKKNVRKWRDLTNAGRSMAASDMVTEDDTTDGKKSSPKKEQNKRGKK